MIFPYFLINREDEAMMQALSQEVTHVFGGPLSRFCMQLILYTQPQPSILQEAFPSSEAGVTDLSTTSMFPSRRSSSTNANLSRSTAQPPAQDLRSVLLMSLMKITHSVSFSASIQSCHRCFADLEQVRRVNKL